MNPERKVEIMLWDWLKCKGNSVKNVYFNSINEVGAEVFRVIGTIKTKPDLVIEFENPYTHNIEYMAIEVKDASKSGNVRGGTKVFEGYFNLSNELNLSKLILAISLKELALFLSLFTFLFILIQFPLKEQPHLLDFLLVL